MCLGIPGCIVRIDDRDNQLATVDICGVRRQINVSCVVAEGEIDACIGMWVLVHVGFAMSRIDEDEAKATLRILTELGEAQAEFQTMNASPT
jgi:hydrogenase expression/formation protein HypC